MKSLLCTILLSLFTISAAAQSNMGNQVDNAAQQVKRDQAAAFQQQMDQTRIKNQEFADRLNQDANQELKNKMDGDRQIISNMNASIERQKAEIDAKAQAGVPRMYVNNREIIYSLTLQKIVYKDNNQTVSQTDMMNMIQK